MDVNDKLYSDCTCHECRASRAVAGECSSRDCWTIKCIVTVPAVSSERAELWLGSAVVGTAGDVQEVVAGVARNAPSRHGKQTQFAHYLHRPYSHG
jgi:hypothetical protein